MTHQLTKDFKVVLNSANRIAGGATNRAQFMVDIGLFDAGYYELIFSFTSATQNFGAAPVFGLLNIDFTNNNVFSPGVNYCNDNSRR